SCHFLTKSGNVSFIRLTCILLRRLSPLTSRIALKQWRTSQVRITSFSNSSFLSVSSAVYCLRSSVGSIETGSVLLSTPFLTVSKFAHFVPSINNVGEGVSL